MKQPFLKIFQLFFSCWQSWMSASRLSRSSCFTEVPLIKQGSFSCFRLVLKFSLVAILSSVSIVNAAPTVLFSDDFNRDNSTDVGNGWLEKGYWQRIAPGFELDGGSIQDGRMRFTHNLDGRNVDIGIIRPLPHICGIVVSGTVEWMNAQRHVGLAIDLNAGPNELTYDGMQLVIAPRFTESDIITLSNAGPPYLHMEAPSPFDLTRPNKFEWTVPLM